MINLPTIIPYILSAITIYMFLLAGNKKRSAWVVGLMNQALWLIWIIMTANWGLLPMNIALWIVYSRNYLKWGKKDRPLNYTQIFSMKPPINKKPVSELCEKCWLHFPIGLCTICRIELCKFCLPKHDCEKYKPFQSS